MPANQLIETQFLVLRKTPYSESSLVLAGLSPDQGQLHFMVRGARRLGRRQFPLADVFRVLTVQYRSRPEGLLAWQSADVTNDLTGVAAHFSTYQTAAWLAKFTLGNVAADTENPELFAAMINALSLLQEKARGKSAAPCVEPAMIVGTVLVFLQENGLLRDYADKPRLRRKRDRLIAMGRGQQPIPTITTRDWKRLYDWIVALLHTSECKVPPPPSFP
ncbi:MAG: recombination protein O N-terminal domain-containing protein [Candidatus Pacebacteria bacterium]|nr:recombination protein O N-terminal domain-containing protein [Candidatus Paceibacterota bacterium]